MDLLPTEKDPEKPKKFILQPDKNSIKKFYPKDKLINQAVRGRLQDSLEREFRPIHIHFTTGLSTAQIPFLYSLYDLRNLGETGSRIFKVAGLKSEDVLLNAFPYAPHLAFWQVQKGAEAANIRALHTGGGKIMGTEKIITALLKMKPTLLVIMPGYGYHLIRTAIDQGVDLTFIKYIIFGGERVSPGLREKVKVWIPDVKILSTYGMTESKTAWVQCNEESGYHLYPDLEFIELLDTSGNRVKEGESGEVTYTALDWRGSVVVRYRTGDICNGISYDPCKYCGRTVPQLHYDIQRKSDFKELQLTKVKGELVNLNAFYPLMHGIKDVVEWQVEIRKRDDDQYEVDELHINIACRHGEDCDRCSVVVERKVTEQVGVAPRVNVHTKEVLLDKLGMEKEIKEKRIVDKR